MANMHKHIKMQQQTLIKTSTLSRAKSHASISSQTMSLASFTLIIFLLSVSAGIVQSSPAAHDGRHTYIIHVRGPAVGAPLSFSSSGQRENWYRSFLPPSTASPGRSRLVYSYQSIVDGFAARLTTEELAEVEKKPGFVHAYPDRILPLQTTRSPDFLGLRRGVAGGFWNESNFGKGVIIGVLDTGVSPGHPSFSGTGMPPPPAKWKGACEFNTTAACNNKLIGARTFLKGSNVSADGPYDTYGHGTHTASTAAGAFVQNANVDGQAKGTAVGMAPLAHLAVYKVCTEQGCSLSDILAGMDAAVRDGVDIVSLSLAGGSPAFYNDAVAIGAFGAIEKGVFVSAAAGNSGPFYFSITNEAPWMLTVGASTIDRSIRTTVRLGNNTELNGQSAFQPRGLIPTPRPLVYPGSTGLNATDTSCGNGTLDGVDVRGKIVLCDVGETSMAEKGENVKRAGGAGVIIANSDIEGATTSAVPHVLPASHVSYADGLAIKSYISSDQNPTATITFKGTLLGTSPAPVVASFSSRGPGVVDTTILKPDIIGPGSNILAAWASDVGTNPPTKFNIVSGTSMSTPHLSGIAALLKSAHPDWSPAAIKSAIMTTAYTTGNDGSAIRDQNLMPADVLAVGAGHVNPPAASNPGLIYEISPDDYIAHLCGLGYSDRQVNAIARHAQVNCKSIRKRLNSDLNYPSFMVTLSQTNFYNVTVSRTVTNVGAASSAYTVQVRHPKGVAVRVRPKTIAFSKTKQKVTYSVTFTGRGRSTKSSSNPQGQLTWVSSDNKRITVNSPVQVILS